MKTEVNLQGTVEENVGEINLNDIENAVIVVRGYHGKSKVINVTDLEKFEIK